MNIDDMNESRFLRASDCGEQGVLCVLCTHESVRKVNAAPLGEEPEEKWAAFHSNGVKPLVLNWTRRQQIAEILGSKNTDDWGGGRYVAYKANNIPFQGKMVEGIRCRAPRIDENGDGANGGEKPAPVRPHPPVPLSQAKADRPKRKRRQIDIPF